MLAATSVAGAPMRVAYSNGITASVVSADELASRLTTFQGSPAIELSDGRMIPVVTNINDPSIYNRGDGSFHPFTPALVERALSAISHPGMPLDVRVYLLPYPRRGVLVSSTSGNEIFLSPHVLDIEPAVAAYIVAHELGHAFHNRYLPSGSGLWRQYRSLRGISDEAIYNDSAAHADRPREIFAEDFRVLFGGAEAYFDGHVENTRIVEPELVDGLRAFFVSAVSARATVASIDASCSPNPFNPETEIRIGVPAGQSGRVSVRIYSVTGALVRDLYDGAPAGDIALRWNGTDNRGNAVASATYYAQIRMGGERRTLKLLLLK
ncbi:MAG TPA: FlgD immunoglobulin-like domain containing protein [Candidatus Krumholzibacteria bacterium]